jgi:hypothetical protein
MELFKENHQFIGHYFLKLIKDNESFRQDLQVAAPEIYADIESFHKNPNCSCKNKILKYVQGNMQKSADFLNQENAKLSLELNPQKVLDELHSHSPKTSINGQVDNNEGLGRKHAGVIKLKKSEFQDLPKKILMERLGVIEAFSVVPIDEEYISLLC